MGKLKTPNEAALYDMLEATEEALWLFIDAWANERIVGENAGRDAINTHGQANALLLKIQQEDKE